MQAYAHDAMSIIDMKYLFPKRWPSAQGDLYRREHCKRNWIRLGAYLWFWRDARVQSPINQRAQIRHNANVRGRNASGRAVQVR